MRAAVMHAFASPLVVEEVPDPAPPPDGAVVEVRASGVCRSDWHGWMGHDPDISLPHVPGHELAGVVAAVGPEVRGFVPGERVTVPFCCGCGRCEPCRHGHTQICEVDYQPGFTAWGSFARYVAVPAADLNLVRLPEALGFVEAASLGCRFMTAYAAVEVHGRVAPGDWVAVHGCGGAGLSAVMLAAARGAAVIAVDVDPASLELARTVGAAHTLESRDPVAEIVSLTGGGAHVSLDALGSASTCVNSIRCLRKRGRHVQVGLMLGDERTTAIPIDRMISYELTLHGVHGMAVGHYDALLRTIVAGSVEPGRLIGRRISLDGAGAELAAMSEFAQRGVSVITEL
jgi:alcohol dehydrogenase